jgi:hypothetical protein
MKLTDERVDYHTKLITDYEAFLAKPHPPEFYTKVIKFREDVPSMDRTNEAHILHLISNAKEQLAQHAASNA